MGTRLKESGFASHRATQIIALRSIPFFSIYNNHSLLRTGPVCHEEHISFIPLPKEETHANHR
jgi:hypothetical protein